MARNKSYDFYTKRKKWEENKKLFKQLSKSGGGETERGKYKAHLMKKMYIRITLSEKSKTHQMKYT